MKSQGNRKSTSYTCPSLIIHVLIALLKVDSGRNRIAQLSFSATQVSSETCKSHHKDKSKVNYLKVLSTAMLSMFCRRADCSDRPRRPIFFKTNVGSFQIQRFRRRTRLYRRQASSGARLALAEVSAIYQRRWFGRKIREIRLSKSNISRIAFNANSPVWKRNQLK